jgi:type IV secretion system protein VirB2
MSIVKKVKSISCYYKNKFNLDEGTLGTTMAFMLLALVAVSPSDALAGGVDATGMSAVVCNIVEELQGPIARGVAAFGIIFLGFSLFLGKISWGVALALGIGVAAIFGAQTIVNAMIGGTGSSCTGETAVVT